MANVQQASPKVFIVYPHNPEHYKQLQPLDIPTLLAYYDVTTVEQMKREFAEEERELEEQQRKMIHNQKRLVYLFASFLQSKGVSVAYDQDLTDRGYSNLKKWCEEKIEESKYVVLIATPSLLSFLKDDVPQEEELLFVGDYMYNLIELNCAKILSVFLDRSKDVQLLPVSLRAGNMFQIVSPFSLEGRTDDMEALYAQISGQDRFQPPPQPASGLVPIKSKRRVGVGVVKGQSQTVAAPPRPTQRDIFDRLSRIEGPLTDMQIFTISEKPGFNSRWRLLAPELGLTPAQIEACEVDGRGYGEAEKCLAMLKLWRASDLYSVARLAHILYYSLGNMEMLEVVNTCISN